MPLTYPPHFFAVIVLVVVVVMIESIRLSPSSTDRPTNLANDLLTLMLCVVGNVDVGVVEAISRLGSLNGATKNIVHSPLSLSPISLLLLLAMCHVGDRESVANPPNRPTDRLECSVQKVLVTFVYIYGLKRMMAQAKLFLVYYVNVNVCVASIDLLSPLRIICSLTHLLHHNPMGEKENCNCVIGYQFGFTAPLNEKKK